jgi:two-component system OmpR family sensor kinase
MSRLTLRTRVALAAAAAVFLAVGVLGGVTELQIGRELRSSLDRGLRDRASAVARLSVSAPALLTAPAALDAPAGGRDLVVEVLDRQRRVVARSTALGGRLLPAEGLVGRAIGRGSTGYARVRLSGEDVRVFVAPLPDGGPAGGGAVVVGASTAEIEATTARLAHILLASALGAALLGALVAAALTSRGMRPLRRLTASAAEIDGDATRRLPRSGTGELAALTRTLNGMLDAIEQARATERRFLADASHELRTPVTALVGNVEFIARHGANPEVLADLQADAARLGRLTDDLLVLERHEAAAAPREPVALATLASEVAARAAGPVTVTIEAEPTVLAGPAALARALENLLANALVHGVPPVTLVVRRVGTTAQVLVRDQGAGLAPEEADAAFGRFWRGAAAARRPGSGLGLAIVRAIAGAHGGTVRAQGATFTLSLPIVTEPSSLRRSVNPMPIRSASRS